MAVIAGADNPFNAKTTPETMPEMPSKKVKT